MCAEKIQRLIQASILGFVMGLAGSGMYAAAFILQFAMMVMLVHRRIDRFLSRV